MGLVPDLPGCKGDGDTRAEAICDTENAILEWVDEAQRLNRDVPEPGTSAQRVINERKALVRAIEVLASDNVGLEVRVSELNDLVSQIVREYEYRDNPQSSMALVGSAAMASVVTRRSSH